MQEEGPSLLDSWNDTSHPYPSHQCLHRLFEEQAHRTPNTTALIFEDSQLTYGDLNRRANRVAHHLCGTGVKPQTPVAICLHRSMEMVVGLLGILKAGCPYVPIDPDYPSDRIAHMIRDCAPAVIITEASLMNSLSRFGLPTLPLDSAWELLSGQPDTNPNVALQSDDLVYIIYTSGSTGEPKGAMNTHRGLVNRLLWMQATFALTSEDRVLQKTPHSFDVSAWEFFWPLITGAGLVLAQPGGHRDPDYLAQCIARYGITTLHFVPSMLYAFLEVEEIERCNCVKRVFCSGEAMSVDLQDRFFQRMSAELHNLYGPTEAAIEVTHWMCRRDHSLKFVPIGRPIWNTRIHILDERMLPAPFGDEGELYIGGDGVALGYLKRPELTAACFVADSFCDSPGARLYKTGDLARFMPDGNIEFLGRKDDQVKLRGVRIELGEIEMALRRHPLVQQAVVTAREDRPGDQRLVAYLVLRAGADPPTAVAGIRMFLKEWLPDHMVPSAWKFLEKLPLTPSGKVHRKALPPPDNGRAAIQDDELPTTELQRRLAEIWRCALALSRVGIRDNFIELGGHSLLAMRVVLEIRKQLGIEVTIRRFFENPTIAQLAVTLSDAIVRPPLPLLTPLPLDQPQPLSFSQQRLWFLCEYECRHPVYNLPLRVNFDGCLNTDYLHEALQHLVDRHASLRTNFQVIQGSPAQLIASRREMRLPITDLSAMPEPDRDAQVRSLVREEARRAFDLRSDLLFRAHLLKISGQHHVLLLNMHHIVSDGWSLGILLDSIAFLYRALCDGEIAQLPPLPIQYADYARWQHQWLRGEVLTKLLDCWKHQLDGAPPVLALPTDRPRPVEQSYRGDCAQVNLSADLCRGLNRLSRQQGATLYMSLLAGYALLLHRHSGQKDIVIGSPISGRTRTEVEQLVGFLVNMLALRIEVDPALTVNNFLARAREIALEAYTHQDLPFEKLVEELKPIRNPAHAPIFQAVLVFQNTPDAPISMPGLKVSSQEVHTGTAKFDLTLSLKETDSGISGTLEFNTDIFDAQTILRMIEHYRLLLEAMVASPEMPIGQLSMLTAAERQQLLLGWNDTHREYPANRCAHELFTEQARRTPYAVAVVCGDVELTYGMLDARADQLSRHLLELGAGPGSLIALCIERSPEMLIAILGIWKTGAAYVALDCEDPAERLAFILADAGAAVLLTQERLLRRLEVHRGRTVCLDRDWETIASASAKQPQAGTTPDALAHVIYTSGSTGQPKGVEVRHRGIVRLVHGQDYTRFGPDRVVLQLSSICFDASTFEIWAPLLHGGRCVICDTRLPDPMELQRILRQHHVTTLWLTASFFNALLDIAPEALAEVEELLIGGEALSVSHVHRALKLLPRTQLINGYGPTENTTFTTCYRIPRTLDPQASSVPIGRPIANAQAYLLDEQQQLAPQGAVGEIYVGGEGLARGYHNRPELTAEWFVSDPFSPDGAAKLYRTGDLGRYLPDGNIEFLGRIDFQLKIRGYRIEPREIELVLERHPAVRQAAVMAREDTMRGKLLVAYVVLSGDAPDALSMIKDDLRSKVPEYMVPSEFVVIEEMPLNHSGKVDRKSLPDPGVHSGRGGTYVEPRTDLERTLAQIWGESLHLDRIGIHDNLFDLGGHSLMTVELSSKIEASLGITVPLIAFFRAPTIAQLAEVLRARQFPGEGDSIVMLQSSPGTLAPLFCVPGLGGDAVGLRDLAQQLGHDRSIYGIQPSKVGDTASSSMESIASLHIDSLRSVQSNGPYYLVGFSLGGIIAYEMARQLHDAGEKVSMLGLIDTYAPGYPRKSSAPVRLVLHFLEMLRRPGARADYVKERIERLASRVFARSSSQPATLSSMPGSVESGIQRRSDALLRALRTYRPMPYFGPILLCRATAALEYTGSHYGDQLLGWGKWLKGEVRSQSIPGAHLDLVRGPNARHVADVLQTFMNSTS
jgi:amino acid adenylation domain-containing protein